MNEYQDLESQVLKFQSQVDVNWSSLHELIDKIVLPRNIMSDVRPFEKEDFKSVPQLVKSSFNILIGIFSRTHLQQDSHLLQCVYSALTLCGEHSSLHLWTDNECIELCERTLKRILQSLGYKDLRTFLIETDSKKKSHGSNIFAILSKKLSKKEWKYHPGSVACYSWLIHQLQMPDMTEFLNFALPVALIILADHEVDNKALALQCTRHILANITTSELHWHIQIEVLHNALKPLFYYREAEIILPLTKCTMEVINKSQFIPKDLEPTVDLNWSYFDEVLTIFFPMMAYEQNMQRRCAYAQSLCLILEFSDFAIGKWTAKIFSIIEDYSKTPITEVEATKALNLYIMTCWPLVKENWRFINVVAGRVLFRSTNTEALENARTTLSLLKELLPEDTKIMDVDYIQNRRKKR